MHVVIINGSPRTEKYSNTEKIIDAFAEGLTEAGASYYCNASICRKRSWHTARVFRNSSREGC